MNGRKKQAKLCKELLNQNSLKVLPSLSLNEQQFATGEAHWKVRGRGGERKL